MKWYIYIMATQDRFLHLGYCKDIIKTIEFYNKMPTVFLDPTKKLATLVYIVATPNKETAAHYFKEYSDGTEQTRIDLVESLNPTWIELIPGVNIEL